MTNPEDHASERSEVASSTPLRWVMRLGPSTKVTTLTTGERIRFTRQALEGVATKSVGRYLPQGLEHLNYLPPIGRIVEMYVEEDEDGEAWLWARGVAAQAGIAGDMTLPKFTAEDAGAHGPSDEVEIEVSYEPRNFVSADVKAIDSSAPLLVRHHALHADLPPLIWALTVSGVGVGWVSKTFMAAFISKVGELSGDRFVNWLVRSSSRAKSSERAGLLELRLDTFAGVRVTAICPFTPTIGPEVERLRAGLAAFGDVAVFCRSIEEGGQPSEMRAATFLWDGADWRLAWWASDEGVFTSPWFRQNTPDPEQFLGHPLQVGVEALEAMLDGAPSVGGLSTSPEIAVEEPDG